jgi:TfoX/Sxy family transcriptional regulator of competence genes
MGADERWATLVEKMLAESDATYGATGSGPQRAFGSTSLKTSGKIFAMLVNGRLVVKLDRRRVDALVAAGTGKRFDPGHGRLMKEWIDLESDSDETWLDLATEAEAFVAKRPQ